MTRRQRATTSANAARIAVGGVIFACGALALAGQAVADPEVLNPTPVPGAPAETAPAPGQPVAEAADAPAAPPAPPPVGAPPVPEVQNPVYGQGKSSSGPLGFLRDAYHQAKDPYGASDTPDGMPMISPPPPGAGPPPPLPPGFVSLTAPGSETAAAPKGPEQAGPALPPGYYPLNGPPPPEYAADAAVTPIVESTPSTP